MALIARIRELPHRNPFRWMFRHPVLFLKNLKWRIQKDTVDRRAVFIAGYGRSGTSLLQLLLGAHSRCWTPPGEFELFNWGQNIFDKNRFLKYIEADELEKMYGRSRSISDFAANFYGHGALGDEQTWLIDKVNTHPFMMRYISGIFSKTLFVVLVRDPRDVYCSAKNHGNFRSAENAYRFAGSWRSAYRRFLRYRESEKCIWIKYEDLVTNPEATLKIIMKRMGEEMEPAQLDVKKRAEDSRAGRKNFQKLGKEIDTSSIGRWKNEISSAEASAVVAVCRDEMQSFGYIL